MQPRSATAILLRAEIELTPLLERLCEGDRRAVIAELTSIAVRIDGVDVAPLFGQTMRPRPDFAADRVVLRRLRRGDRTSKKRA